MESMKPPDSYVCFYCIKTLPLEEGAVPVLWNRRGFGGPICLDCFRQNRIAATPPFQRVLLALPKEFLNDTNPGATIPHPDIPGDTTHVSPPVTQTPPVTIIHHHHYYNNVQEQPKPGLFQYTVKDTAMPGIDDTTFPGYIVYGNEVKKAP